MSSVHMYVCIDCVLVCINMCIYDICTCMYWYVYIWYMYVCNYVCMYNMIVILCMYIVCIWCNICIMVHDFISLHISVYVVSHYININNFLALIHPMSHTTYHPLFLHRMHFQLVSKECLFWISHGISVLWWLSSADYFQRKWTAG